MSESTLDAELMRRLWALYDAAKPIYSKPYEGITAGEFAAFFRAFADVPESYRKQQRDGLSPADRSVLDEYLSCWSPPIGRLESNT